MKQDTLNEQNQDSIELRKYAKEFRQLLAAYIRAFHEARGQKDYVYFQLYIEFCRKFFVLYIEFCLAITSLLFGMVLSIVSGELIFDSFRFLFNKVLRKLLNKNLSTSNTKSSMRPPEFAKYLLRFLPMTKDIRENVVGDLEEDFQDCFKEFGRRKAVILYYRQVIGSFWPFAVAKVQGFARRLVQ